MTSVNFCYWLQSTFELMKAKSFDEEQTQIIKNHLAMVFHHEIDPSHGDKAHQGKLNEIHSGQANLDVNNHQMEPSSFLDTGWNPTGSPHKSTADIKYRC